MAFNRTKTFRYASIKPLPNEVYVGLKDIPTPSPTSNSVAASATYIAAPYSSKGSVVVVPVKHSEYKRSNNPPLVSVTSAEVTDLHFSPHNDSQFAVGSSDGTVKVFTIPQGGLTSSSSSFSTTISGSFECVHNIKYHPVAEGVLAVGHKQGLAVMDLGEEKEMYRWDVDGFGKDIVSVAWNRNGSLLGALTKSNQLNAFDPRQSANQSIFTSFVTASIKKTHHVMFTGESAESNFMLFGLSSGHRPLVQMFDPRKLSSSILDKDLDYSNGFVLPAYDYDTKLLFLTVRGSNVITLFDVEPEKNKPSMVQTQTYSVENPFKGLTLIGKRGVNTNEAEIQRVICYGQDSLEPYSVQVPRKTVGFHEELYPFTAEAKANLSAAQWKSGENFEPAMVSMVNVHLAANGQSVPESSGNGAAPAVLNAAPASSMGRFEPGWSRKNERDLVPEKKIELKEYIPTETRKVIENKLKTSIYRHVSCKEPPTIHDTYYDLKLSPGLPLAENIRGNSKFFAVPWQALGGSAIAVFAIGAVGRSKVNQPCVRGHKSQATAFDMSVRPNRENLLASGSVDGDIRVYAIPEGGLTKDLTEELSVLQCGGKVVQLRFHPLIDEVLVSASSSFDGHLIEFWDLTNEKARIILNCHPDQVMDIAFHPDGALIATTCKDGRTRVIDIHSQKVIKEFSTPEGTRDTRVVWAGSDRLITTGFGNASARSISYWNIKEDCKQPVETFPMDRVNNIPIPRFDEDTNLLFVANNGGTFLQLIEVKHDSTPHMELLNTFQTATEATGYIFLPKTSVDVKKVEIVKALKLTKDSCQPYSHCVPRKRLEFFQDDLFPSTRSPESLMSTEDFFSAKFPQGKANRWVSLNVFGLTPLSEAPEEELTDRQKRYQEQISKRDAPKVVGPMGHQNAAEVQQHFKTIASQLTGKNRWDAAVDNSRKDVDDAEWD